MAEKGEDFKHQGWVFSVGETAIKKQPYINPNDGHQLQRRLGLKTTARGYIIGTLTLAARVASGYMPGWASFG